jgi:hypothetical protein
MFRNTAPHAEPAHNVDGVMDPADLIPLSILELDLDPPSIGWVAYLANVGITITTDDIGRNSITKTDARRLILEKQEREARKQEIVKRQEQRAVELDQQWRAQLSRGTPWYEFPDGVSPAEVWAQAEKDAQPKRRSVLEETLAGEAMTFHPIGPDEDPS